MRNLFPVFLKLRGRRCVVVGGGPVAEAKLEGLLQSEADVVVTAPKVTPQIDEWIRERRLTWHARPFEPGDLARAFLVIAATGLDSVNEAVFREADARGVLCNAVDEPERCHFYYPAVVRRGPLQVAISTGGCSPALAHRLRIELEEQFGPEFSPWLEWLGERRRRVLDKVQDPERRKELLGRLASEESFERFRRGKTRRAEGIV